MDFKLSIKKGELKLSPCSKEDKAKIIKDMEKKDSFNDLLKVKLLRRKR